MIDSGFLPRVGLAPGETRSRTGGRMTTSQLDINALTDGFVPTRRGLVAAGGLAIGTTLAMAGSAQAATFTVSNLNDSGSGSLRQAVLDANANSGADTMTFASGVTGTIVLSSGQL